METHSYPDGLGPEAATRRGWATRYANPLSLILLGAILLAALLGLFGGGPTEPLQAETSRASLTVRVPHTLRNGEFFETRISVRAHRAIAEPVIGISPALWRDVTINTTMPQAAEETFSDGLFRLHYAALAPGDTLRIKFDGQINPPMFLGNRGTVVLLDGDRPIAAIPIDIRVWP